MNLKFAIIPWSDDFLKDSIFDINHKINRDHLMDQFCVMQKEIMSNGDELHTVDMYDSLKRVDWFLFFVWDKEWYKKVEKAGKSKRMIYCNAEPPSVDRMNTLEGYKYVKKFFPYIMTWNTEWVDNKIIFRKPIMYSFFEQFGSDNKVNNKLLTLICGNKTSTYPGELYSERLKVIDFFENNHPEDFDFYGIGWNKDNHNCYKGMVDNKRDVYHNYKFAICFENIKGLNGYVTEKIFDCICMGIVPIYCGAPDIKEYVNKECFIDYNNYNDLEHLYEYLIDMPFEEYTAFLDAGKKYLLESEKKDLFSGKQYAKDVYKLISCPRFFYFPILGKIVRLKERIKRLKNKKK